MAGSAFPEVSFSGLRSAVAPLSWAQRSARCAPARPIPVAARWQEAATVSVSCDCTPEDAAVALRRLAERHESLRTIFPDRADGSGTQTLLAEGEFSIRTLPTSEGMVREAAGLLKEELTASAFQDTELPLRIGVVCVGGRARRVCLALSPSVSDDWGAAVLADDLRALLSGSDPAPDPAQQSDLIAFEQGDEGIRQSESALRYWDGVLRDFPADRSPQLAGGDGKSEPDEPGYRELTVTSAALAAASHHVADRAGLGALYALTTGFAAVAAHASGARRHGLTLVSANRPNLPLRTTAAILRQPVPLILDLEGGFDEVARRCWTGTVRAYRHGRYDPAGLDAVLGRTPPGTAELLAPGHVVHVRSRRAAKARTADAPLRDPATLADRTEYGWRTPERVPMANLCLEINHLTDVCVLTLGADGRLVTAEEQLAVAHGLEALLVAAAAGNLTAEAVCGLLDGVYASDR